MTDVRHHRRAHRTSICRMLAAASSYLRWRRGGLSLDPGERAAVRAYWRQTRRTR